MEIYTLSWGVLTLTWHMYLHFEMLFCKIWHSDRWVFITDEGAKVKKLGVFRVNYCKKHPIWVKFGAFLSKMVY